MKKLLNAVTIIFCIFLTACTHSDNTAANPAVTEMSETHGNSAEVISSQAVQTTESDLQHSKVNAECGEVKRLLSDFAVESRRVGEAGRDNATKFISDKLKSDGWYVTQQEFPVFRYKDVFSEPYNIGENGEPVGTGINIIAELPDFDSSKPTLIFSAHYDTTKENIGIIDNGSGTAFLLSAGKWISKFNGEYNLRLIFFDVEESRMYGSKYYLENLSLEEHSGIIADINFDMLGGNHLSIGTVNGFESALSIYLEQLTGYEYELSDKGSSSDSDPFMYWQIPALTFIDSDLPADPCEDVSYLDYVSDESFDSLALQLADIINGFDIAEFAAAKSSQIVTEYNEKDPGERYRKMASLSVKAFRLTKSYTVVYENGISSCYCCDYISEDGRSFSIQSLSEVGSEDFAPLNGIPYFEDCIDEASDEELLVDKYIQYKIVGELSDNELMDVWSQMRL